MMYDPVITPIYMKTILEKTSWRECSFIFLAKCPSEDSGLTSWTPESDRTKDVVIGEGMRYRLENSVELKSIYIKDGGQREYTVIHCNTL